MCNCGNILTGHRVTGFKWFFGGGQGWKGWSVGRGGVVEAVAGVRGRAECRILNVEYIVTGHTACGGCDRVVCGTVEAVAGARGRAHCGILDVEYIVTGTQCVAVGREE